MLILEALARHLDGEEPVDGFSAKKLRNYYLLNPLEEGERGFKLVLTQTDKQSLLSLIQQMAQPAESSVRITDNFAFFEQRIEALRGNLTHLCNGLAKLVIVDVSLTRDQDNPQLIFESMNSTGRALSQADLIRNFILMGLEPTQQTRLYEETLASDGSRFSGRQPMASTSTASCGTTSRSRPGRSPRSEPSTRPSRAMHAHPRWRPVAWSF